jgi:hypothetical protein
MHLKVWNIYFLHAHRHPLDGILLYALIARLIRALWLCQMLLFMPRVSIVSPLWI